MRFACMYKIDMETAKSSFFSTYIPQRPIQNSHLSLPESNIDLLSNNAFLRVTVGVGYMVSAWLPLTHYTVLLQMS